MNIREKRNSIKLSQAKLAALSGVNQAKISSHELGKKLLSSDELNKIYDVLLNLDESEVKKISKKRYTKLSDGKSVILEREKRSYERTERNLDYRNELEKLAGLFNDNLTVDAPKALSFFAGCGGLCYGMKAAGFDIIGVNELEEAYREIYKINFPNANFLPNDIRSITNNDLCNFSNVDLLIGGPPCQGFSLSGKRDVNDERNTLFKYYLDIADQVRPKVILMENVKLLTSMRDPDGSYVKDRILDVFKKHGYISAFFEVNAKNYGVPQHRERVFFVGIREDINIAPSFPEPIFYDEDDLFNLKPFTFGDAVSDLPYIESGESSKDDFYHSAVKHPEHVIRWLVDVPEGKSAHDNQDDKLRPPSGYNTTYKRQVWNEPASTVATTFSMISGCRNVHPIATRSLTIREALRLQSFPDSFQLKGKLGDIRTTIGNAVPPLLSFIIGKYLKKNYIL